ncbi:hypothetical protein BLA29_013171 [Euroglyphus maynei]|uniref:Uncharacterized protein n=1 Tax=Euroglyphus maynei TaxID=6958 RepID=A0A1Y3BPE6_EURMA|nr:hypothetical protein BLA29_013171 [Euroglyphus maynei]
MAQPFLADTEENVPVQGALSSSQFPFPLGRNIVRASLTEDHSFIEAKRFVARNSEVYVTGKLWKICDFDNVTNVHRVELVSDSYEIPYKALSHLNSFIFEYRDSFFVNYTVQK